MHTHKYDGLILSITCASAGNFHLPCKSSVITCHQLILTSLMTHTMCIILLIYMTRTTRRTMNQSMQSKATTLYKNLWLYKQSQQNCTNTKALYQTMFTDNNQKHQHFIKILIICCQNQVRKWPFGQGKIFNVCKQQNRWYDKSAQLKSRPQMWPSQLHTFINRQHCAQRKAPVI